MKIFSHKKGQAMGIGVVLATLVSIEVMAGWLPADNPDTEVNETMMALAAMIAGAVGLPGLFIAGQAWSDGRSNGATATKLGFGLLLVGMLGMGCAAPPGVIRASENMAGDVGAMANMFGTLTTLTQLPLEDKRELMLVFNGHFSAFKTRHELMHDYLGAGVSVVDAKEYVKIGRELYREATTKPHEFADPDPGDPDGASKPDDGS